MTSYLNSIGLALVVAFSLPILVRAAEPIVPPAASVPEAAVAVPTPEPATTESDDEEAPNTTEVHAINKGGSDPSLELEVPDAPEKKEEPAPPLSKPNEIATLPPPAAEPPSALVPKPEEKTTDVAAPTTPTVTTEVAKVPAQTTPPLAAQPPPAPTITLPANTALVTVPSNEPYYPGPYSEMVLAALIEQHNQGGPVPLNLSRIPVAGDLTKMANQVQSQPITQEQIDAAILTPAVPEVSIILNGKAFIPNIFRIRSGVKTKLFFTSVDKHPSAVVIEKLTVQRWIAQHDSQFGETAVRERPHREGETINREVNSQKMTEIILDPQPGKYGFHDPLSGARGEIIVE